MVIENSFADTRIVDFSGDNLDVLIHKGDLDLQVKNVTNRINIESQHAGLVLGFGVLADPTISLKTRQGHITADSPLSLDMYEENAESFLNRSGSKPEIHVNNVYGDIHIRSAR